MSARLAALALAIGTATACDTGMVSDAPPAGCREAGEQCALPDGPLGVCERASCGPDAAPPCFRCVPQH